MQVIRIFFSETKIAKGGLARKAHSGPAFRVAHDVRVHTSPSPRSSVLVRGFAAPPCAREREPLDHITYPYMNEGLVYKPFHMKLHFQCGTLFLQFFFLIDHFNDYTLSINFSFISTPFWTNKQPILYYSERRTRIRQDPTYPLSGSHLNICSKMDFHMVLTNHFSNMLHIIKRQ